MKKIFSIAVISTLFFSVAVNAVDSEDAIEYRQAVMETIVWNVKPMGAMMKGKVPFDTQAFAKRAKNLAFLSGLSLEGFIAGSYDEETDAKANIETNWEDFKAKMADFEKEAAKLAEVAKNATKLKDVGTQFKNTVKTCKACHKKYKKR